MSSGMGSRQLSRFSLVDETREMNIVKVSFLVGKFGKKIPVVDSFVFYPKDRDRVRFACKTRGCNVTITMTEGVNGPICARVSGRHNHPNHERAIEKYTPLECSVSSIFSVFKSSKDVQTNQRLQQLFRFVFAVHLMFSCISNSQKQIKRFALSSVFVFCFTK